MMSCRSGICFRNSLASVARCQTSLGMSSRELKDTPVNVVAAVEGPWWDAAWSPPKFFSMPSVVIECLRMCHQWNFTIFNHVTIPLVPKPMTNRKDRRLPRMLCVDGHHMNWFRRVMAFRWSCVATTPWKCIRTIQAYVTCRANCMHSTTERKD